MDRNPHHPNRLPLSGTVHEYDEHDGHGWILPDSTDGSGQLFIVHRHSLRNFHALLRPGDRVTFQTELVPRGILATDVHPEMEQSDMAPEVSEGMIGEVHQQHYDKGFGFIAFSDGRSAFFHVSYLPNPATPPPVGSTVQCNLVRTAKGTQARDIAILPNAPAPAPNPTPGPSISAHHLLPQAVLARDSRDYPKARDLYERGLREDPSVQLVLSYAAMEKNLQRRTDAMLVYERGIALFPRSSKLREDAGVLSASMGETDKSIVLLTKALELCRATTQGGEKGVLLALARVFYQRGDTASLRNSVHNYQAAHATSGRKESGMLPAKDQLAMNLAQIRLQHHRGKLAYDFVLSCGFPIIRANLHPQTTVGADIIVHIDTPELKDGYGIFGHVLLRCMFKSSFSFLDLEDLDHLFADRNNDIVTDQIVLLVLASVPDDLQRLFFDRIDDRANQLPTVVPLPQDTIETEESSSSALHNALDRWLYRRDLFATNFPVIGRRFFGRERPMAELREAIVSGTPVGVFGLRKVGKTSLLKETARRASDNGDVVVYVDLLKIPADVVDATWLYWRIANLLRQQVSRLRFIEMKWRLGGIYEDFLDVPSTLPVVTGFDSDLSQLLKHLEDTRATPKPKVILLLDEIERLLPSRLGKPGFSGFFDFLAYLRGVSQETTSFVVMVTGANAAVSEASQFDQRDNPVFNYFREIYLQLLEREECTLMIRELGRGMGLRYTDEACDVVFRMTGGHPFFARQLCSFVAARHQERPLRIAEHHVSSAIGQYMQVSGHHFREIFDRLERDYPGERDVCLRLAEVNEPIHLDDLQIGVAADNMSVRHLLGYQIVSIDEHGRLGLTMELLKAWLRAR